MLELAGVYTALVTPFRNGSVDYPALKALLQEQLDAKVAGIVPVGTSGESPTLTVAEHLKVIEEVINFVNGLIQIFGSALVVAMTNLTWWQGVSDYATIWLAVTFVLKTIGGLLGIPPIGYGAYIEDVTRGLSS